MIHIKYNTVRLESAVLSCSLRNEGESLSMLELAFNQRILGEMSIHRIPNWDHIRSIQR